MRFQDFIRKFVKVISSISITGTFQAFSHWFITKNIENITTYFLSFNGNPQFVIIGLLQIMITHYVISFNLLFRDWFPNWIPKNKAQNHAKVNSNG